MGWVRLLSVLIEKAARNQIRAESVRQLEEIDPELARELHDFLLLPSVVRASFAMFARRQLLTSRFGSSARS